MTPKLAKDIYNYDGKYDRAKEMIAASELSSKNKEVIFEFEKACFLEGLSKPRRMKLMDALRLVALNYLHRDFETATERELKEAVYKIEQREDFSVWTKQSYRAILKKFYKWLAYGDDARTKPGYPDIVSWINTNIKYKDVPRVQASEILTEAEIKKLIDASDFPRDKAFICMLYELGARISEIGNLKVKDVSRDKYSYIVDLQGKTGHRTPRIVISDPYITSWLNVHPSREEPESPLWVMLGNRNKATKMTYAALRALLLRTAEKARVKKRIHPHLLRHTRVTHLLLNKQINEAQAKVYFGWTPSSKMLSDYSHLISSDVNETILQINGIKTDEEKESVLKPKQCPRCNTINSRGALFCQQCSAVLDTKTAVQIDEKQRAIDEQMMKVLEDEGIRKILLKKLVDLGFGDDLKENSRFLRIK